MKSLKNLKVLAAAFIIPVIGLAPLKVLAAAAPINTGAKVSFTFDDGYTSAYTQAAPTLAKYGFTGTSFAISGCVGMTKAPNTCHADNSKTYMTWAQLQSLQNTYGWEIGDHTVDHYCLASNATIDPDDCQANTMTTAQVDAELANSKAALTANGLNVSDMATPYGDYNQSVLKEISKYFASQRGFADTGYNTAPYNQYILRDQYADGNVSLSTMEGYVNQAIASNQWLIFTFHDINTKPSKQKYDYEWSTANLGKLAAYVKSKTVPVVNIRDGLISGTNLLTNPSFENGLSGWSTDAPGNAVLDSDSNGSYPNPVNSVRLTSSTKDVHLFSGKVPINPNTTYMLQSFMNITNINSGYALGYYIDEYNSNGSWISGQYKQSVSFPWPQTAGFEYKPTSSGVASAALQVIVPANSGIQAYVDSFQWIDENPSATPPPTQTNLVPNGTFDAGIADGWSTDAPGYVQADANGNGSPANPVNSIRMTAGSANTHLFSPKVGVISANTYSISTYVNMNISANEIGFYMDEYDANGSWISGQYITGDRVAGANTISFNYTPSSSSVKNASLQIICVGNSGITAYIDNVVWLQN